MSIASSSNAKVPFSTFKKLIDRFGVLPKPLPFEIFSKIEPTSTHVNFVRGIFRPSPEISSREVFFKFFQRLVNLVESVRARTNEI